MCVLYFCSGLCHAMNSPAVPQNPSVHCDDRACVPSPKCGHDILRATEVGPIRYGLGRRAVGPQAHVRRGRTSESFWSHIPSKAIAPSPQIYLQMMLVIVEACMLGCLLPKSTPSHPQGEHGWQQNGHRETSVSVNAASGGV